MENNKFALKALKYIYDNYFMDLKNKNYPMEAIPSIMEDVFEFESYKTYDRKIYLENPEVFEEVFANFFNMEYV